jgi:hypothetical protein
MVNHLPEKSVNRFGKFLRFWRQRLFDVRRNGTELGKKKRETLEELGRGIPRPNSWA